MATPTPESAENAGAPTVQWRMALTGPIANLTFARVVAMLVLGMSPTLNLLERPSITPAHLIRSIVWLNVFLGVLNLLPAYPLDGGRVVRGGVARAQGRAQGSRVATGLGQILAMTAIIAGLVLMNPWLLMAGFSSSSALNWKIRECCSRRGDTVNMQDITLTQFSMLAPSDTLEDALTNRFTACRTTFRWCAATAWWALSPAKAFFPALRSEGNGYVQAVMSRSFHERHPAGLAGDHHQPLRRPGAVAGAGD